MKVTPTRLPEVLIFEPRVFGDERGFFLESFRQAVVDEAVGPMAQGKLVRVTQGRVLDVAVDLRRSSPRFGQWVGVELSGENHRQLWVPPGFAHGFLVLSDSADFLYKTTNYYAPQAERCIRWDDPAIGIDWPDAGVAPQVSAKDAPGVSLTQAEVFA